MLLNQERNIHSVTSENVQLCKFGKQPFANNIILQTSGCNGEFVCDLENVHLCHPEPVDGFKSFVIPLRGMTASVIQCVNEFPRCITLHVIPDVIGNFHGVLKEVA
jgi:hypothetical protein